MGIKERRNNEKEEMKRKIMKAATEIINENGYESLSIRKIASKIEYSPTAIYIYYKDKAQIITDMTNGLYSKTEKNIKDFLNNHTGLPVEEQIREIMLIFIRTLIAEPEMARAIIHSRTNIIFAVDDISSIPSNEGIKVLDKLLSIGIKQKKLRAVNEENAAWMLVSAILGFLMCVVENQIFDLENFNKMGNDFVDMLINGIKIDYMI